MSVACVIVLVVVSIITEVYSEYHVTDVAGVACRCVSCEDVQVS